jgi:hypothetical protein
MIHHKRKVYGVDKESRTTTAPNGDFQQTVQGYRRGPLERTYGEDSTLSHVVLLPVTADNLLTLVPDMIRMQSSSR